MASQVTNYQCPTCGGPLHYDTEKGLAKCDYCGSEFDIDEVEKLFAEKDQAAAAADPALSDEEMEYGWGEDAENVRVYVCPSCGAELITDATTGATSCPYCGNPTIVPGQFNGALKPEFVIPFKLTKEQAKEALKEHYKGKKLLPSVFSDQNHIDEIKGIYVPFWLFDGKAEGSAVYEATRSHITETPRERITETDHFNLYRSGSLDFVHVPVDGAYKMPDEHMDSIEPFDFSELKEFSTAYLPGFYADKYDVSKQECAPRAYTRVRASMVDVLRDSCRGFDGIRAEHGQNVNIHTTKVHYALLPVWMLYTNWNGEKYLFAMNGQTGKFVGDLPTDKGKYWKYFISTAAAIAAAFAAGAAFIL